ncbi:hypothetical protein Q5762_19305 [Streptomyces sp. P9(2023)]|uniref:hypothetical protein n=1 Tax=Streptomyces sp. P9(2023) TaxID=3064394 RepID=UPI0028F42424|nr:hypothetical protein [Streptomyces sp. P9(2023)]MDT9690451.1 hypothetical protein [Streptomyces sp. P9(2023)]
MGNWIVVAQRGSGDSYVSEVIRRVTGTREDAREAMRAASLTYHEPWREKSRQVYRFPSGDSCLVIVRGLMAETQSTLSIAELVHDSADPGIAKAASADEPQDRVPPMDWRPSQ